MKKASSFLLLSLFAALPYIVSASPCPGRRSDGLLAQKKAGRAVGDTTSIIAPKDTKLSYSAADSVRIDKTKKEIVLYGDARVTSAGWEIRAKVIRIQQKD